uniref:Uncharacterized protein n=1 Tax=Ciona savignyi TaxID=51511 RepID=H2YLI7_CIOSA
MQSSNVIESRSSPRRSRNGSVEKPILNSIHEDAEPSFNSTQQLRSGFFRSIKKSYPSLALEGLMVSESPDSGHGDSIASDDGSQKLNLSLNSPCPELRKLSSTSSSRSSVDEDRLFMSSLARRRLQELREADPTKVDVSTGLQWIRLELHEMREQDKALFLQLIKLHSTIKDLRSDLNCVDCDSEWSYDDLNDAASLWWPRYSSTGGTSSVTILPDFSSSDGAQMLRKKRPQF